MIMIPPSVEVLINDLILVFGQPDKSIEVIEEHFHRHTFWPMKEEKTEDLRRHVGTVFPNGLTTVDTLGEIIIESLKHHLGSSNQQLFIVTALMCLLAAHTTTFFLGQKSLCYGSIPPQLKAFMRGAPKCFMRVLLETEKGQLPESFRLSYIIVMGALAQDECYEEVLYDCIGNSGGMDVPYYVLFAPRQRAFWLSDFEERLSLECASLMLRDPPERETRERLKATDPAIRAVHKYGALEVARGIHRLLSKRLSFHPSLVQHVLFHMYGAEPIPWIKAGVPIAILENIWNARRLDILSSGLRWTSLAATFFQATLILGTMIITDDELNSNRPQYIAKLITKHDLLTFCALTLIAAQHAGFPEVMFK
ncbi:hypothetical protein FRB90_006009, partial [Tulasnella sp. 427]